MQSLMLTVYFFVCVCVFLNVMTIEIWIKACCDKETGFHTRLNFSLWEVEV
eukprot:m.230930 g.230930  ORF g.230930 m.230930 type:complete len:51 (-) comp16003_c0_seq1:662-814(-)